MIEILLATVLQANMTASGATMSGSIMTGEVLEEIITLPELPKRPVYISKIAREPVITAKAFLVADAASGEVLMEHEGKKVLPMASITKLMTVAVALERFDQDEEVRISKKAANVEGAKVGFLIGERVKVRELVYASIIRSGNDAAYALAEHAEGGMDEYIGWMNEKASELELEETHYVNPVGFDHSDQYSSARDILTLAKYVLDRHPMVLEASGNKKYAFFSENRVYHRIDSTNKLLGSFLDIRGLKTGTTVAAGASFVGVAEHEDGQRVIAVVLNSPFRFQEAKTLMWWAFEDWEWR